MNDSGEIGIDFDLSSTVAQLAGPEIFKPALRGFHAMEPPVRTVGERHSRCFFARDSEITLNEYLSLKKAGKPGARTPPNRKSLGAQVCITDDAIALVVLGNPVYPGA